MLKNKPMILDGHDGIHLDAENDERERGMNSHLSPSHRYLTKPHRLAH